MTDSAKPSGIHAPKHPTPTTPIVVGAGARVKHKITVELLTASAVAARLGVSRQTFYALRDRLLAKGLRTVKLPGRKAGACRVRYMASSLDRLLEQAADGEKALC